MNILKSFDDIDAIALRGTSSLLLLAGLARWVIAEGRVTLKHRHEAAEELRKRKEAARKAKEHTHV